MSVYRIQLNKIPNQAGSFNITDKNNKTYSIDYSIRLLTNYDLSITISINGVVYSQSKIIRDRMPLLLNNILGGNLYFKDLYGNKDPEYNQFNERYVFCFDTEYELG